MGPTVENWSTQQLAEFLAVVTSFPDEVAATRGAVERAAEALECEVAAILKHDEVVASIGFPDGRTPRAELAAVAAGELDQLLVPAVGACVAMSVPLEAHESGSLVLARAGSAARNGICSAAWAGSSA
jgi:hypothetical protein